MTSAVNALRLAIACIPLVAACRPAIRSSGLGDAGAGSVTLASAAAPVAQVQLAWRLVETRRWLDGQGEEHQSSIFELLVVGGTPSHVQLGRRESFGCAVSDTSEAPPSLTGLACYSHAHGEYANAERPRAGELRIEAFGQDEAYPDHEPPRTNVQTATVRIPVESDVVIDQEVITLPSDAPPRGGGRPTR